METKSILSCRSIIRLSVLAAGLGLGLGFSGVAEAACTGSSPTWTSTADRASVNTCVTNASSGDTINVTAGTATWSTPITLSSSKDVSIIGATVVTCTGTQASCTATDNTVLTCTSVCFGINTAASHRVSGFRMTIADTFDGFTGSQNLSKHFRFDHNHVVGTDSFTQMWVRGGSNGVHPQGVFDHNLFENVAVRPIGSDWQLDDGAPNARAQHVLWAQVITPGENGERVFIEYNHFKHDGAGIQSSDSNYGGRYVFRFNLIDSGFHNSEVHGSQGENRGSQVTEIYKNNFSASEASGDGGTTNFRGGTGMIWGNLQAFAQAYGIDFTVDRSEYDEVAGNFGTFKECGVGGADGNSPSGVDQQTGGANGWRCRDQVGIWYDTVQWQSNPPDGSFTAWNQVTRPVYVWLNLTGGSPMSITVNNIGDVASKIVVNREFYCDAGFTSSCANGVRTGTIGAIPATCTVGMGYWATNEGEWDSTNGATADGRLYKCTSTDTWALYYTPYTYPHPWAGGSGPGATGTLQGEIRVSGSVRF